MHSAHVPDISCSILLLLLDLLLLFIYFVCCLTFHSFFVRLLFHLVLLLSFIYCSLFKRKIFDSDPGLYSRYFVLAVQETSSSSMQVNKQRTSDCNDFVLV